MTAYFRIRTADGRRYVGSVQGFGGQLGGGAAHLGPEREKQAALRELQTCINHLNATGRWGGPVLESRAMPGHCIVRSVKDWKVPHDGCFNRHEVPLAGATVALLSDDEVRTIPPGTCREDRGDEKALEAAQLIAGLPVGKSAGGNVTGKFKIGDLVSWVNDSGVKFPERTVIGLDTSWGGDEPRYFLSPNEAHWMSVRESALIADADDPVLAEVEGHKIRTTEVEEEPWFVVGLTNTVCRALEGAIQYAREHPCS